MSVQAISWVLDNSTARGTDRLVLIAIANHAGAATRKGAYEAWPGVETIAREAGLDRTRTVQEALSRLVASGVVERVLNGAPDNRCRPDRRPNLYRIVTEPLAVVEPETSADGVSDHGTPSGVTPDCTPPGERGDAPASNGVTSERSTGCRSASPKPSGTVSEPLAAAGADPEPASDDTSAAAAPIRSEVEGEALLVAAARLLAERRRAHRPDVGAGWVYNATNGIAEDHRARARALLDAWPAAVAWPEPSALADLLEPPPDAGASEPPPPARPQPKPVEVDDLWTQPDPETHARVTGAARASLTPRAAAIADSKRKRSA